MHLLSAKMWMCLMYESLKPALVFSRYECTDNFQHCNSRFLSIILFLLPGWLVITKSFNGKQVAQVAARAALQSSGQNCAGAERFYVHKDVYSSFVAEVVKIVKSVAVVSTVFAIFLLVSLIRST